MSELNIGIYDHESGETIVRPMNEDEIAQWEESKAQSEARKEAETAKAEARQSAIAKLIDLGLSEEEAQAFLG